MTCERYNPGIPYRQDAHFQLPWWAGYNEAARGADYRNDYATLTARYEYQQGYLVGAA
jgi:hypothetical protein